ncbi:ubiquinol-cytochrome-c reductase complex assembly factor 1-like [Centruroides sculpturatus]|uniref:ubiquinol-cytochrome-c reductase complex assembly factor 1-like n=1 Tax=Centruroides sculpturatus TaxID=218467 RepID=UPI000C6EE103|nr:ubiquinol-cytochrome-c reductase complex assembly factor 1-like [Centruroides sculpturatus]XP_023219831.1 ubiquinol-cytochrome-c reductase complex assembly factor 1-like [Centruroides sculpturatus]XP_023219832.1 ubiquinol-cytochrome-c reductase complex assembly factor 1-like [Centruroides sculpturatus]XP_023219833.1 ubiquinol-cytochrome-c reductase complex assembly factor 1-like [Centruroides sculpturatus]XP_023219834.1 ubiquinol-cytochrome-c reductase complex assembly factor 1-like [Centrur
MFRTIFQNNIKISKSQNIYTSSFARWIYDTKQNHHTIINQNFNNSSNMTNCKGSIKSLTSSKLLNFPIAKPSIPDQDGFFKKIGKEIKWNFYVKGKRESSAIYVYEACADNIDVKEFFSYFKLPDTFTSWFLVIELHVW